MSKKKRRCIRGEKGNPRNFNLQPLRQCSTLQAHLRLIGISRLDDKLLQPCLLFCSSYILFQLSASLFV